MVRRGLADAERDREGLRAEILKIRDASRAHLVGGHSYGGRQSQHCWRRR